MASWAKIKSYDLGLSYVSLVPQIIIKVPELIFLSLIFCFSRATKNTL